MKNLTIKTFFIFLLLSILVIGAVYTALFIFTPYSNEKKYAAYVEAESKAAVEKCMSSDAEDGNDILNSLVARTGADVKLLDAQELKNDIPEVEFGKPDSNNPDFTYPFRFQNSDTEYMLKVTCSDVRIKDYQKSVQKSIPVVVILSIILSFAGAKIFSYYMKRPIVRMSKIAQRMSEQDFDWYCPDERDDEIGVLAKSLNKLSDELSAALTKLNDKNLYLKNEISLEKERERRRMLFFSGVSHELKTPISVVIGQIEGMRSGIGVYKDRDKYLEKCSNTLNELVNFINEILLVSHIDMGDVDDQKTTRIDSILDEEIAFYDGLITEKNIELEYEVPDNVNFRGDENLLKKALGNVLGNAFKYTPEGGTVKVQLTKLSDDEEGSGVELKVINSPAHIDEQHLSHLFEAFYRADTSNKDGSGLGLYITGMVLEMFDAEYSIRNTDEGVEFKVVQ